MTERPPEENWHDCACGERHWGTLGAAGLLAWRPDGCFLLHHRGEWTHHGGTWALPGGARRAGETFRTTALREAAEEVGLSEGDLAPRWWHIAPGHGRWTYTTVGAVTAPAAAPLAADWETAGVAWVDDPTGHDLHPGFAAAWPGLAPLIGAAATVIVDAANVVGSRPDGWWRDRAGATARLRDDLAEFARRGIAHVLLDPDNRGGLDVTGWWPRLVLVTEGQARPVTSVPGVDVTAAPAAGDDEIVHQAELAVARRPTPASPVAVATADRELICRVRAVGATVIRPSAVRP